MSSKSWKKSPPLRTSNRHRDDDDDNDGHNNGEKHRRDASKNKKEKEGAIYFPEDVAAFGAGTFVAFASGLYIARSLGKFISDEIRNNVRPLRATRDLSRASSRGSVDTTEMPLHFDIGGCTESEKPTVRPTTMVVKPNVADFLRLSKPSTIILPPPSQVSSTSNEWSILPAVKANSSIVLEGEESIQNAQKEKEEVKLIKDAIDELMREQDNEEDMNEPLQTLKENSDKVPEFFKKSLI